MKRNQRTRPRNASNGFTDNSYRVWYFPKSSFLEDELDAEAPDEDGFAGKGSSWEVKGLEP